jgi:phage gp36-like protein
MSYPKNAAHPKPLFMELTLISDGSLVTTGASMEVSVDGGTPGAAAGTLVYVAAMRAWKYTPTQAETNGDVLAFTLSAAGAESETLNVMTDPAIMTNSIAAAAAGYIYNDLSVLGLYIDTRLLVQLTNDSQTDDPDDSGNIDETILAACEREAATTINNYLRVLYTIPLAGAELTDEIRQIDARLTLHNLYARRNRIPRETVDLYNAAIKRLADMRSPKPDELRPAPTTPKSPQGD